MGRYLKIFFLVLLLFVFLLVYVSIPIVLLFYVYISTKEFSVYLRFPVLAFSGAFLFLMAYTGFKKGRSKTKLFKGGDVLKSKLP